jgi:hypothetical protein
MQGQSVDLVVHSSFDVNFWIAQPPTVDVVRPGSCPRCGQASRVPGSAIGMVGHGHRGRQLRGPPSTSAPPATRLVHVRRYRCRACGAVVTVVPRQVLARRHFAAGAIAIALFVYGKLGEGAIVACQRVGSWARGSGAWRTLRRWIAAIDAGRLFGTVRGSPTPWTPRRRAERAAMTIAACAPEVFGATEEERVFAGAAFAT